MKEFLYQLKGEARDTADFYRIRGWLHDLIAEHLEMSVSDLSFTDSNYWDFDSDTLFYEVTAYER